MTEIDRANQLAHSFINQHEKVFALCGVSMPILNSDFIFESSGFQEVVIQHIRLNDYKVKRVEDGSDLLLQLSKNTSDCDT